MNSFNQFAPEQPYGEGTQQSKLAGGAPLAGQPIAAGPLGAAKASQRKAVKGNRPTPQQGDQPAPPPSMAPTPQARLAAQWAAIAAIPGASDDVKAYAALAQRSVGG